MSSKEPNIDEIRKHFRESTSKLDRWIFQGKVEDYLNTNSAKAEEPSREIPESSQGDPPSKKEAPKTRAMAHKGCGGAISWKDGAWWSQGYTCEKCGKVILSSGQLEEVPGKA